MPYGQAGEAKLAPVGGGYKGQPWVLFDRIAAYSFLIGDNSEEGKAIGSRVPAISSSGEMVFFAERSKTQVRGLTNMDAAGGLSYGMEVYQMYLRPIFPIQPTFIQAGGGGQESASHAAFSVSMFPQSLKLAECILHWSVIELRLGQEDQTEWPALEFPAGAGLDMQGATNFVHVNNGTPTGENVLTLPPPGIQMPRMENISVTLRLRPEAMELIGTPGNPGVGAPLPPFSFVVWEKENENGSGDYVPKVTQKRELPFAIEFGFKGKRVKKVQSGQLPGT